MTTETLPLEKVKRRRVTVLILLIIILVLGAFLRFYKLGAAGFGNQYYAAAVKSMLQSWHNFFFVAFEPGGSVSVDKPPMGFWVQTISAWVLGFSGFSLALPNALAGVASIFVIYKLVCRPFGNWAGLGAALALALMPVAISTERNNTIDGLLVFVLLMAAWAFMQAVRTQKSGWLFLGVTIVGLGFNIKMLQAFLPLPALYAVYFFGIRKKWWKKLFLLAAATILLLAVSLSWAVMVDLTPADERPYVGSSTDNSVMELIIGHNGLSRITGLVGRIRGQLQNRPYTAQYQPAQTPGVQPDQDVQVSVMDFGSPGIWRLFTVPLVDEASWLLPFVLVGMVILIAVLWKRPFTEPQLSLILWTLWLVPEAIYFSFSQGLMHAYYLIMLGPPLAALFAMTGCALWQVIKKHRLVGWVLTILLTAGTFLFQAGILKNTTPTAVWAVGTGLFILVLGISFVIASLKWTQLAPIALFLTLSTLIIAPLFWSVLTTYNPEPNGSLPYTGPAGHNNFSRNQQVNNQQEKVPQVLVNFLIKNTKPGTYLLAMGNAKQAAPFILATDRPVFTFGGFKGSDNIIDAAGLADMVADKELRFVLAANITQKELALWVRENCRPVPAPGVQGPQSLRLLDCAP